MIVKDGLRRMYGPTPEDIFYYITVYNENYATTPEARRRRRWNHPEGLYKWADAPDGTNQDVTILFSGTGNLAAREAQEELAQHYGIGAELWSATSYKALRDEALEVERWNRLNPGRSRQGRPW